MYVIQRRKGEFVAIPGSASSYTTDLRFAMKFSSRENAERERCKGNETVQDLERILDEYRS